MKSFKKKQKTFAFVAQFFCGHTYSTDLIGPIFSASEPRRKKLTLNGQMAAYSRKIDCEEKKDKTVSAQSTSKTSTVKQTQSAWFICKNDRGRY